MSTQRAQRVGRQLQQEISMIVERDLVDPRLELVTFTAVKVTPDLRTARVYYSCLGGQEARDDCGKALDHAKGMLRREIGRRLALRYVPDLRFEFDDSLERSQRISELLGPAVQGRDAPEDAGDPSADPDSRIDEEDR
jgi:ribosome-binding factor A